MKKIMLVAILFLMGCRNDAVTPTATIYNKTTRDGGGKKEALLVGVSDYKGIKYDLSGIEIDISNMKSFARQNGFNVTVLMDSDSMDLKSKLNDYASSLGSEDTFLFYYTGHGYHIKDTNGDEQDGEDEALVLSDGRTNQLFLDDSLNGYLNSISAKKMVVLDSCHSGTAFKAFGDKSVKAKTLFGADEIDGVIETKAFRPQESRLSKGDYVIFSASEDKEESLATSGGSLFTNAFVNEFQNGNSGANFANIRKNIEQSIIKYCNANNRKVHHPQLSSSKSEIKYGTLNHFLNAKERRTTAVATPPTIKISGKTAFKEGELLTFDIDTNGNSGYLTIFSIEEGEPFIMAQTDHPINGKLTFQKDFKIARAIECYKGCKNCQKEISSVYVILSAKPLSKQIMKSKGLQIDNQTNMRAFRHKTDEVYEPVIAKIAFTIY